MLKCGTVLLSFKNISCLHIKPIYFRKNSTTVITIQMNHCGKYKNISEVLFSSSISTFNIMPQNRILYPVQEKQW